MNSPVVRNSIAFFLPGGLIFAAALVAAGHRDIAPLLAAAGEFFLYAMAAAGLLLGWRFDRSRLVFAAAVVAVTAWLLDRIGARPDASGRIITDAATVLLPLNIALIAMLKERGIFTRHGLIRWSVILVQPLAVWGLLYFQRYDLLGIFDARIVPGIFLGQPNLEQPALLGFAIALAVTGYKGLTERSAMETGLFWALMLVVYALFAAQPSGLTTAMFASAILILIVALVEVSHFMAFRDELTGLPGRRTLTQDLLKLGSRYSVAMLDVDHFKKFNDRHGHDVGDQVLKMVAAKLQSVSGGGKPYRYGGEEFTILFPGKPIEQALPHLEQVRASIADAGFVVRAPNRPRQKGAEAIKGGDQRVTVTISIGAAERQGEQRDPNEVIKAADEALYRAKKAGRNRVAS